MVRRCTVGLMLLEMNCCCRGRGEKKKKTKHGKTNCRHEMVPPSSARRCSPQGEGATLHSGPSRSVDRLQTLPCCNEAYLVALCPAEMFYFTGKMGHLAWVRPFVFLCFFHPLPSSTKVSGAPLASGPFSWKLQLGYAVVYHTALVTSLSSPRAALRSPGAAPPFVFGRPQSACRWRSLTLM